MTTQAEEIENKSAAKHIVGIFREILKELRSDEWNLNEPTKIAALLTIASVLDQQGDTHTESLDQIAHEINIGTP